jgi:hypothetical protein
VLCRVDQYRVDRRSVLIGPESHSATCCRVDRCSVGVLCCLVLSCPSYLSQHFQCRVCVCVCVLCVCVCVCVCVCHSTACLLVRAWLRCHSTASLSVSGVTVSLHSTPCPCLVTYGATPQHSSVSVSGSVLRRCAACLLVRVWVAASCLPWSCQMPPSCLGHARSRSTARLPCLGSTQCHSPRTHSATP